MFNIIYAETLLESKALNSSNLQKQMANYSIIRIICHLIYVQTYVFLSFCQHASFSPLPAMKKMTLNIFSADVICCI